MTGDVTGWLVDRYGPRVDAWVAGIPALAARLAANWGLELGEMFAGGASAVVFRCVWPDGTPAVLKLSPDRELLGRQAGMLRLFAESGRVPAVLAADPEAGGVVLTEVRPGTLAEDLPPGSLPPLWAGLLAALHAVPVPAQPPGQLGNRCDEAFDRVGKRLADPLIGRYLDQKAWALARERCHRLLDTQQKIVLLHGDLHLGNALDGGAGLIAIDPKACAGDPCWDAVDYVLAGAGREGVRVRCERVASACGLDGDRLHEWTRAIAPFALIGQLLDNGPGVEELLSGRDSGRLPGPW